ncbi:MAG: hypothetical protein FWC97_09795, partial [Treponema sp.]|nr:hypothetical protein [Treponema sp.]
HCFEVFQTMSDLPIKDCPECGKEVRRLIFGGAGVIFKGSGFYVTDKAKSAGKPASVSASSKKSDSVAANNGTPCSQCPANDGAKCPAVASKSIPESKSA